MAIEIREVSSKKELKQFVAFVNELYKDCPYYCPPLWMDELNCFDDKKNPASEVCEHQLYMAYRDGEIVGRICAIINHKANEHWGVKKVRVGWFDFVDDEEVSRALLDAAVAWGKSKGMTQLNGPVGFTDMDHQGLLLEGFEYLAPMASLYNYPYYERHYEAYGLKKEVDWVEFQVYPPKDGCPERIQRIAAVAARRAHVRVDKVRSVKELKEKYGYSYMDLLSDCYEQLYNYQPLTERQKKYYADMYFPILNFDFVTILVNEKDEIVGVGVGMPDISEALKKCGGKLLPWGWFHLLRALKAKKMEAFNFLLIAIRPDYRDSGIMAMFFDDQIPYINRYGIQRLETTSILETNTKNQANFIMWDHKQHKRRRAYMKEI